MKKIVTVSMLGALLLLGRHAHADGYSDCQAECSRIQADCIAQLQIGELNEQGKQDLSASCNNAASICGSGCQTEDNRDSEAAREIQRQEQLEKAQQERAQQEKERQEKAQQEQQNSGGIGNTIKTYEFK
jgi:hypothetical protein